MLLVSTLSITFFEAEAGPVNPVDSLMISATTPHQADGVDFSTVLVSAFDVDNNPVIGANIIVASSHPPDFKEVFMTTDNGDGTYSAQITSINAGTFTIIATDGDTEISSRTEMVFLPGPVVKVQILEIIQPRESESQTTAELIAVAVDANENVVGPPDAQLLFATNLGNVASVNVDQKNNFIVEIFSSDLGTATITVTEQNTGFMDVAQIDFTPVHLVLPPDGSLGVGDTFSMPIVLYVPGPAASPPWDVSFSLDYDTSVFQVMSVDDGDTGDLVPLPVLTTSGTGLTLTSQSAADPFPFDTPINFAVVTFQVRSLGPTFNSISSPAEFSGSTETTVAPGLEVTASGSPVTVPPSADVTVALTVKPTNNVCVKFWIAPGAYPDDATKDTTLQRQKASDRVRYYTELRERTGISV